MPKDVGNPPEAESLPVTISVQNNVEEYSITYTSKLYFTRTQLEERKELILRELEEINKVLGV